MIKNYNKVAEWLDQVKSLKPTINIKLDKEVYNYDTRILKQYYKVKKINNAFVVIIDLETKKIISTFIDTNYTSLKKLRKNNKK